MTAADQARWIHGYALGQLESEATDSVWVRRLVARALEHAMEAEAIRVPSFLQAAMVGTAAAYLWRAREIRERTGDPDLLGRRELR